MPAEASYSLASIQPSFNPFPGLRPFEEDEDHLFFGREKQIDELLARLRTTRFVAVVGTSGSGKSSLVRSGLIPSLYSGFMAGAGSAWRVAVFRPGGDPISQMAAALSSPNLLGRTGELADVSRVLIESTLRRGTLGLVEAVREARVPPGENVLIVIDQFEELFRFRNSIEGTRARDEAAALVKLLLEAAGQQDVPIYLVLTMRSDFLGDCMQYAGLPEAVTAGQYLVPRMSRDELRSAITGPVAVARGAIAPRLVVRLLNDVSDDPDQLPVLQHALMRTWDYWAQHRNASRPGDASESMDIADYEAIGTMRHALSLHAEEAYAEAESEERKRTVERAFKALTDTFSDPRGIRRPTSVRDLSAICETEEQDLIEVIELFRRPGRCFLMPPAAIPLESESIVDISHESVMRCWDRLIGWAEEERASASRYVRLSRAAAWCEEGTGELWRGPTLEMGIQWLKLQHPNAAWAGRYDPSFERAMDFLERSRAERDHLADEQRLLAAQREVDRRRALRRTRLVAVALGVLLVVAAVSFVLAYNARKSAERSLNDVIQAVNTMLQLAGSDSRTAADIPQVEAIRKQLADTARKTLLPIVEHRKNTEDLQVSMAQAHVRLGDINRILQNSDDAIKEYQTAIAQLDPLVRAHPDQPRYRQQLANAYNWLGESERLLADRRQDAVKAYESAIMLQEALGQAYPANLDYRRDLARAHYNRGIAQFYGGHAQEAEADYQAAIGILQQMLDKPEYRQDLARVYNDLALLLTARKEAQKAAGYFGQAIAINEALAKQDPGNRDYALDLADFYQNLGILLRDQKQFMEAETNNGKAISLYENLARPAPAFTAKLAYAHTLRGRIVASRGDQAGAAKEYQTAIDTFAKMEAGGGDDLPADFHLQYGDSLLYLGSLWYSEGHSERAVPLLAQAATNHAAARSGNLSYDYYLLTQAYLDQGSADEAKDAFAKLSESLKLLPVADRKSYEGTVKDFEKRIERLTSRRGRRN
ncbi:MAG TPA: tetratricopeptide repeat protein [Bryobacteraceae bacterium]|jgi:tetratricopeptide (TPR) repeat protein/energy-coupling factor transporter ATP-binding protein EcfA2